MFFNKQQKMQMPSAQVALKGRETPLKSGDHHFVNGLSFKPPIVGKDGQPLEQAVFGLGCFWGAERKFWQTPGVVVTAVGYAAGYTPNPTYEEVCSGMTGHNEVVLVVFDPSIISYEGLLKVFFEAHDPTQGYRQGGDTGTQYRSGIYTFTPSQAQMAQAAKATYNAALKKAGLGAITTEILPVPDFYYAEEYHQQYLAKNPGGYCGIGGTGVTCAIGTGVEA
jgi:peptide-methionine (S)-S-oxide reductase